MRRIAALVVLCLLSACQGGVPQRAEVLDDLATQVYIPAVVELAASADDLRESVEALCAAPGEETLADARETWSSTVAAWGRTDIASFGPASQMRLESAIRFVVDEEKVLALAATNPSPDEVAQGGADVKGLDAIGILLLGTGSETLTGADGAGRCVYAAAAADGVAVAANQVADEWNAGFADRFSTDSQMHLKDAFNSMARAVDEAARGILALRNERPTLSVEAIGGLVEGASRVYVADEAGLRMIDLVPDREVAAVIAERFDTALAATRTLGEDADAAYEAVNDLLIDIQSSLAGQLGVTLMFSDADGDS